MYELPYSLIVLYSSRSGKKSETQLHWMDEEEVQARDTGLARRKSDKTSRGEERGGHDGGVRWGPGLGCRSDAEGKPQGRSNSGQEGS